jgi:hypothetical protein
VVTTKPTKWLLCTFAPGQTIRGMKIVRIAVAMLGSAAGNPWIDAQQDGAF